LHQFDADFEISPVERVKILVAKMIGGLDRAGTGAFAPAMVGVRGEVSGAKIFEAGDLQLTLELQSDPEDPGGSTILGLALGLNLSDYTARLFQDGEEISSVILDNLGNFVFHGILSGTYDLVLKGSETEIHIPTITV
jgi:hypothetical protein